MSWLQAKRNRFRTALGSQNFQPLGTWPIDREGGSFGMTGSGVGAVLVPTNIQGLYSERVYTRPDSNILSDVVGPKAKPQVS